MYIPYLDSHCHVKEAKHTICKLTPITNVYIEPCCNDCISFSSTDDLPLNKLLVGGFTMDTPNVAEQVIKWLDAGAKQCVLFSDAFSVNDSFVKSVTDLGLPSNRLLVSLPLPEPEQIDSSCHERMHHQDLLSLVSVCSGLIFRIPRNKSSTHNKIEPFRKIIEFLIHMKTLFASSTFSITVALPEIVDQQQQQQSQWTLEDIITLHHQGIHVISNKWSCEEKDNPLLSEKLQLVAQTFIAGLKSDRQDGLIATVVTDEAGVALGLVYSNEESILTSLESGRGVYYSRSRGGLWKKGESSGHYQDLIQIDADCDSDALRFMVRQHGDPAAFCHLNIRSCWGSEKGLQGLESVLQKRKNDAPLGSYTKKLFDDSALLRNKLVEEAQELIEANEKDHVAAEAADVMFFTMVRCVAAGATLSDVEKHLDKRSFKVTRRPGLSKPERIANANKILKGHHPNT